MHVQQFVHDLCALIEINTYDGILEVGSNHLRLSETFNAAYHFYENGNYKCHEVILQYSLSILLLVILITPV